MDPRRNIISLLLADTFVTDRLAEIDGLPAVLRKIPVYGWRMERGDRSDDPTAFDDGQGFSDGSAFSQFLDISKRKAVILVDAESVSGALDDFSAYVPSMSVPIRIYARHEGDDADLSALAWRVRTLMHNTSFQIEGGFLGSSQARGPMPLPTDSRLIDGRLVYADLSIEEV